MLIPSTLHSLHPCGNNVTWNSPLGHTPWGSSDDDGGGGGDDGDDDDGDDDDGLVEAFQAFVSGQALQSLLC